MKSVFLLLILFSSLALNAAFDDWFYSRTLRIDYYHSGDEGSESYSIDELVSEPYWGGSKVNLLDTFQMGEYFFKVYDIASNTLLYSHGYSSLFAEWQFTEEAKHTRKSFSESLIMPFPKNDVRVEFMSRDKNGEFARVFEYLVDADSYFIRTEQKMQYPSYNALVQGDPSVMIDIVILPDGYSEKEMSKFRSDCDKFVSDLFAFSPFKENREKFNIRGVIAPSEESGTDIPGSRIWKRTILNTGYYTFDSERYLMTYDNKSVRELASNTPYDQVYILVNSTKYGGGAIYNYFSTSVNSNSSSAKILVHEFGHGFAGLGDEYDDGSTSFNDMYSTGVEPWEPNLTTLTHFNHKWEKMLPSGTPVPTPIDPENQKRLGVYEGGGYVAKGVYRPLPDCLMRSFSGSEFCPVCTRAILRMIEFQTK